MEIEILWKEFVLVDDTSQLSERDGYEADREYKIRTIVAESRKKYLIDWEDDEQTGETFEPTWEPKAYANQLAIEDWK